MVKFKITSYFDPMGDRKSDRKKYDAHYYHSETLTIEQIKKRIEDYNSRQKDYYTELKIKFSDYKIIGKNFDKIYKRIESGLF